MITVTNLAIYVFAAMTTWVPMSNHSFYEKEEITHSRYESIANTIAEVSLNEDKSPIFNDEDDAINRAKTALLLASIASYESSFKKSVDSCKEGGDNGLAWGLWQTHSNKKKTCANRLTAAYIALGMVNRSFKFCSKQHLLDKLSIYTDGRCKDNWYRSRSRIMRALSWHQKHKEELIITNEASE